MLQLYCINCQATLEAEKDRLICKNCFTTYPLKEGIPCFSSGNYYFEEISPLEMDECLSIAEKQGWDVALHDYLRTRKKDVYNITSDESRADWRFLVPLSKESVVLDMGCGWGALSFALAEFCKLVVSMDCSFKRLKFLNIKRRQKEIKNILPICGGDSLKLPFGKECFDLVILNGVLEWLGMFHDQLNPKVVQLKILKNIYRSLKKKSYLYIGIENRFGYDLLLGGKDHSGLRFTSFMPRNLADLYTRLIKGEHYRTYTYTFNGYRNILKEVGFKEIDFYMSIPSFRNPFAFIPLDQPQQLRYFLRYFLNTFSLKRKFISISARILLALNLFKYFVPSFSIFAKK